MTPATTTQPYVRYRADLEQPFPDEDELIRQVVGAMQRANRQVAAKHRHGLRDAHAKSHGVLAGELRVEPDLPEHLAQGLFAAPAATRSSCACRPRSVTSAATGCPPRAGWPSR